jgi:pimeloyl-ACP methyl ester carboxylesterase
MNNLRIYGNSPFNVAVIHGGPGAAGGMAPLALQLSLDRGVLEPLQTATSIDGQVEELNDVLKMNGNLPVTLIGFSWGAWLSFIFAAKYPKVVKKLVLIGTPPFEEKYADKIQEIRLNRLDAKDRAEIESLFQVFYNPAAEDKTGVFKRIGVLFSKADALDPITREPEKIDLNIDIFQRVWTEAAELRKNGKLLEFGKQIHCPVIEIHGDYDPHPPEGVQKPLSAILEISRFILLENCGHKPWIERQAEDKFYKILNEELG